jgi:hypothetical protein
MDWPMSVPLENSSISNPFSPAYAMISRNWGCSVGSPPEKRSAVPVA